MNKEEFISKFNKLKSNSGKMRVKIQKYSWRLERKPLDRWVKIEGKYFSATTEQDVSYLIRRLEQNG